MRLVGESRSVRHRDGDSAVWGNSGHARPIVQSSVAGRKYSTLLLSMETYSYFRSSKPVENSGRPAAPSCLAIPLVDVRDGGAIRRQRRELPRQRASAPSGVVFK